MTSFLDPWVCHESLGMLIYLSREQPDWFVPGQVTDDILGCLSAREAMALPNDL